MFTKPLTTKPFRACAAAILLAALPLLFIAPRAVHAAEYKLDIPGMHAFIQFRIYHLGYSVLVGRFNEFDGSFTWDREDPAASTVNVTVQTASIDSNHAERDKHLREEDFLNVKKYPTATFISSKYEGDAAGGQLHGELTLHGVTRPIIIDLEYIGEGDDPWGGYRAGFKGHTRINRADFGMSYDLGPKSADMDLDLFIEGVRQ